MKTTRTTRWLQITIALFTAVCGLAFAAQKASQANPANNYMDIALNVSDATQLITFINDLNKGNIAPVKQGLNVKLNLTVAFLLAELDYADEVTRKRGIKQLRRLKEMRSQFPPDFVFGNSEVEKEITKTAQLADKELMEAIDKALKKYDSGPSKPAK